MRYLKSRIVRTTFVLIVTLGTFQVTSRVTSAGGDMWCFAAYAMDMSACGETMNCNPNDLGCSEYNQMVTACQTAAGNKLLDCLGIIQ